MTDTANPRLTGAELVAKVHSMKSASKTELVTATGYVDADGSRLFTAFHEALLEAKGVSLGCDGGSSQRRAVSFKTTVLGHGGLLIGKRYVEDALGLSQGGKVSIEVKAGKLVLSADQGA